MHILLTGGSGLIGSALIERFLSVKNGSHTFTVLTRGSRVSVSAIRYVNTLEDIPLDTAFDAVVNLAGEPIANTRWTDTQKQLLVSSRIDTTQALINFMAMLDSTPPVLISGSAVGWYGDQGENYVTEESNPHQEFTHELCKLWEDAALAAENFGVRVCLLRTGLVLSSKGGFLNRMLLPFKLGLGGKLGTGKQYMPWVHIDDIVSMILFLIKSEMCVGAFNGTAPTPISNIDFTRALGKTLRRPVIFPVPAKVLEIVFGEMSRLILTGQNAIPDKFVKAGYTFSYPEIERALKSVI